MLLCLPILGYGFFESTPTLAPKSVSLLLRAKGIEARGFESPKGFVVRAGSKAVKEDKEAPSIHAYLRETRAELVRQGVFVDRGVVYELIQDYAFSSPSMASGGPARAIFQRSDRMADSGWTNPEKPAGC
jgi:hypothetical protein